MYKQTQSYVRLNIGDFCPHCGFIITLPPDVQPTCLCCWKKLESD
ncbi:hypothetical protein AN944_00625 [Shewanella sp. P1-14-1]|nr:hypothetical protein AN944_00625 [Shewanella sp. P1-14-1]